MKHFKFLFALVIGWMAATVCVLADEVTFNYTHQGVTLPYLVLSETDKTCGVISQRDDDLLFETMKATSIVIPETVTYNGNTYTVISIETYAFSNYDEMTSITLPETLETIGWRAFDSCDGITTVIIPAGVKCNEAPQFWCCFNLKDVFVKARDFPRVGYSFSSLCDNCSEQLTFHVSGCIYQQVVFGSKSGFVFGSNEDDQAMLTAGRIVLDEGWVPQVGDMIVAEVPVMNSQGTQSGTRKVFFTFTNANEGQRETIIYRPALGKDYDPATCWKEGGSELCEEAMIPVLDGDNAGLGTLMLPSTVSDMKGNIYIVKGIGAYAFNTNEGYIGNKSVIVSSNLTGISIPKGYTHIGVRGLRGLGMLKGDLFIPSTVVQMGDPSVADGEVFPTNQGQSYYVKNLYIFNNDAEHFNWYQTSSDEFNPNTGSGYYQYRPTLHVSPTLLEKFRTDYNSGIGAWNNSYYRNVREFLPLAFKELDEYDEETIISTYTVYEPGTYGVKFDNVFNLSVTFSSSDTEIAKIVPGENGYVNIIVGEKTGMAIITASAPDTEYCDNIVTTLKVTHKGPAELGNQENINERNLVEPLSELTKITFGMDDLSLVDENYYDVYMNDVSDWFASTLQEGKIYASAFATLSEGYYGSSVDKYESEGYYSYYGNESGYRLCYNPTMLTPNWGADVTEAEPGENVGGMLCFLVPAGEGTIVVKGYTDSDNAKMGICIGIPDAEQRMIMSGCGEGEYGNMVSKEFTYEYINNSGAPSWVYIYGISLKPQDGYRGHIESITYLPDGMQLTKLSIAGTPVPEGTAFNSNGVSVTWESLGGGVEGGDPEMGGESGDLVPFILLDNANIAYDYGPVIEVNGYKNVSILLKGHNTLSSLGSAAISFGTMNGQDWEGCSVDIKADAYDPDATLTVSSSMGTGLYNYDSNIFMYEFTGTIAGNDYGILLNGQGGPGEGYPYFYLGDGLKLELSGDKSAFLSNNCSYSDIQYDMCPLLEWQPKINEGDLCEYDYYNEGQFIVSYEDEEGSYVAETATYLRFGPPYFIAHTSDDIDMKFEIIDEEDKECWVFGSGDGFRAVPESYTGSVTIPESVTYEGVTYKVTGIDDYAFRNCYLTSLSIPEKVTYVGYCALDYCYSLTEVYCYAAEPPTIGSHYYSYDCPLYVPAGTKDAYQTSNWSNYFNNIEEMVEITPGDGNVNGDKVVDADDVLATVEHILGLTPDDFDASAADTNGDGEVTIADVVIILNIILTDNASGGDGE